MGLNDTIMTKTLLLVIDLLVILQILLFQIQQLTMSLLPKNLKAPLLLNYKTKKHHLAFEKNLFVSVFPGKLML